MKYVKIENGTAAPYSIIQLKADNPETAFATKPADDDLATFGVYPVDPSPPPVTTAGQVAEEADPALIDGVWTQQWRVRSRTGDELAEAKAHARAVVNARRDAMQDGQVKTPFGTFDCNERSRVFIHGGVTEAMIRQAAGDATPLTFTTADNVDVSLAPDQMIGAGRLVLGFISEVHFHARGLKAQIEQAASFADLAAIDLETGWPGA